MDQWKKRTDGSRYWKDVQNADDEKELTKRRWEKSGLAWVKKNNMDDQSDVYYGTGDDEKRRWETQ